MLTLEERRRKRRLAQQQKNEERRRQLLKSQNTMDENHDAPENHVDDESKLPDPAEPLHETEMKQQTIGTMEQSANVNQPLEKPSSHVSLIRPRLASTDSRNGTEDRDKFPYPSNSLRHVQINPLNFPQSSISFSQDNAATRMKPDVFSRRESPTRNDLSSNMTSLLPNSTNIPTMPPKRKRPVRSDSSSSEEFDILELAELKEKEASTAHVEKRNPAESNSVENTEDVQNEDRTFEFDSPLLSKKSDDENAHPAGELISNRKQPRACNVGEQNETEVESFSTVATKHTTQRRPPRNPLTRMKEDEANNTYNHVPSKPEDGGMIDHLWADLDIYDEPSDDTKIDSKKERKGKTRRDSSKKVQKIEKPVERQSDLFAEETYDSVRSALVELDELEDYKTGTEALPENAQLKPEFQNPKFGPYEMEPLVLSNMDENATYQVPASIARYLPPYQREGIEFAFKAITTGKGAILGHDMGLGKTIQTVGLVAALLRKTGTLLDLVEINKRIDMIDCKRRKKQEAIDDALKSGKVYTEPNLKHQEKPYQNEWTPILILAPSSVVNNWKTDFSTWGHFAMTKYEKENDYSGVDCINEGLAEILIASHSIFMMKQHFEKLAQVPWKLAVIDEFHLFKNEKGIKSINIREMRERYDTCILGLTGTLMQNDHYELWNLVDIVAPSLLGTWKRFNEETATPIKFARTKDASAEVVDAGRQKKLELQAKLDTIHQRKTKESVLKDHLPRKDERIVFCDPSPLQKAIYKHMIQQPDFLLIGKADNPCMCGVNDNIFRRMKQLKSKPERIDFYRRKKNQIAKRKECCYPMPTVAPGGGEIDHRAVLWRQMHPNDEKCEQCPFCIIFPAMQLLFKVSTHVGLIQPEHSPKTLPEGSPGQAKAMKDLQIAKRFIPPSVVKQLPGGSLIQKVDIMNDHFALSGKMKVLDELLRTIARRDGRVLLFSASTSTLDLIESYICSIGYNFLRMDGKTSQRKRIELAEEFKSKKDVFIFLLSTKAMGLGLNLTSAAWVIIFDVEWNPSYDKQAQDRSYRIGQSKDVKVFRLVSSGTIEELRYLRQVYKTQLESETLADPCSGSNTSKRIFRGVANEPHRRGELFGIANLLRFNETGTFMNYGPEADESTLFNQNMFDMSSFLSAAQKMPAELEDTDETAIQAAEKMKLERRRTTGEAGKPTDSNSLDTFTSGAETSMLGGDSQACLDFCENIPVYAECAETEQDCGSPKDSDTQFPMRRFEEEIVSQRRQESYEKKTADGGILDTKPRSDRLFDEVVSRSRIGSDGSRSPSEMVANFDEGGKKTNFTGIRLQHTKKISDQTINPRKTKKKKTHQTDLSTQSKTTFSAFDLALPSGYRKRRKNPS